MSSFFDNALRKVIARVFDGTGFAISANHLVTAYHVIKGHGELFEDGIFLNGIETPSHAKMIWSDEDNDVAVLEMMDSKFESIAPIVADFRPGDKVWGLGYQANGTELEPFYGTSEGSRGNSIKFKDTSMKPGLSGSPLLNFQTGGVCGIVSTSRNTSGHLIGGYATLSSILESSPLDFSSIRSEYCMNHFEWFANASSACSYDKSLTPSHFNLFPFGKPIKIRDAILEPRFHVIRDHTPIKSNNGENFFDSAIDLLEKQNLLFVFGGYGSGKTLLSKELQLRLYESGWHTCFLSALDFILNPNILEEYAADHSFRIRNHLLVVDALDETYLLNALNSTAADSVLSSLLRIAGHSKIHLLVNSRLVPTQDHNRSMTSSNYLEDLSLRVLDGLEIDHSYSLQLEPFDKKKLDAWLINDFDRRKRMKIPTESKYLDASIIKRARNNLLHSCYNPLFAFMFSDRFYQKDDSFDDIYNVYESFVSKTIQGKFSDESKFGHEAIKEIRNSYRTIIQEMAISVASLNELSFERHELDEWRIDENRKRFVVRHESVLSTIDKLLKHSLDDILLKELSFSHLRRNVLSCYFFEECETGWRFRDNNILFFLLAEVLRDDLLKSEPVKADNSPLTSILPRFSKCSVVPIHPVAVRMWLSNLKRYDAKTRNQIDQKLVSAYLNGYFLGSNKNIEDPANEFRLELYLALAMIHLHKGGFDEVPNFFKDLRKLAKRLSDNDSDAFNVYRASIRYAEISEAIWVGHNLNGFNFSDCALTNVRFNKCKMSDIVVTNLQGNNVEINKCKRVKLSGEQLTGSFKFSKCDNIDIHVTTSREISLTFIKCGYIKLSIDDDSKRSKSGNFSVTFSGCKDISKSSLTNLNIKKLHLKNSKYHTFNIKGSRVNYLIQDSKCLSSKKKWNKDGKTRVIKLVEEDLK